MGIPKFFAWLAQRCPQMIHPLSQDSIVDVDCLYLDMNGIIHQCKQGKTNESEMMMAVFQYIEGLVDIVRPKKYLFMGVDGTLPHVIVDPNQILPGVAPRAKQNEQRQRRWRNYAKNAKKNMKKDDNENEGGKEKGNGETPVTTEPVGTADSTSVDPQSFDWACIYCTYINDMTEQNCGMCFSPRPKNEEKGKEKEAEKGKDEVGSSFFDSISITPGTPFMSRLSEYFHYFIRRKIEKDRVWQQCKVIFSGSDVPGEGEHKIMDFIRERQSSFDDYSPDEVHSLYGLDADLIMLGLATHEKRFTIFREFVHTGKRPRGRRRRRFRNPEETFQLLDIPILRDFIFDSFKDVIPKLHFAFDLEKTIDDFILMLFLCGNDFLPPIPTLDIGEGALNYFFGIYKDILPSLDGYITETHAGTRARRISEKVRKEDEKEKKEKEDKEEEKGEDIIHFGRLEVFLKSIAALEEDILNRRVVHSKRDFDRRKFNRMKGLETKLRRQQNEERKTNVPKTFAATPAASTSPSKLQAGAQQFVDLADFVDITQSECLNAVDSSVLQLVLLGKEGDPTLGAPENPVELTSDSDEQLLIKIGFRERVKLLAVAVLGPAKFAPKTVSLFTNNQNLTFSDVDDETPTQEFEFTDKDVVEDESNADEEADPTEGRWHLLKAVKFNNVSHLTIFIRDNQGNEDVTKVTQLVLFGVPIAGTDLKQLKHRAANRKRRRWGRGGRGRGRGGAGSGGGRDVVLPPLSEGNRVLLDALDREIEEEVARDVYLLSMKQLPLTEGELMQVAGEGVVGESVLPSTVRYAVEFGLWRELYYRRKLDIDATQSSSSSREEEPLSPLLRSYVEGLVWIFKYYFQGIPSWDWFYPYHYTPLASDLVGHTVGLAKTIHFSLSQPLHPYEQLLSVLPPDRAFLLPEPYRSIMIDPSSPVADFYPRQVQIDSDGKKNTWEYILLLPLIDTQRLLEAVETHVDRSKLSPQEKKQNEFGVAVMFSFDSQSESHVFPSPLAGLPDIEACHCNVQPLPL